VREKQSEERTGIIQEGTGIGGKKWIKVNHEYGVQRYLDRLFENRIEREKRRDRQVHSEKEGT
jgi:hypothetical protein